MKPGMNRTKRRVGRGVVLPILLSHDEHDQIQKLAKLEGLTMTKWARKMLLIVAGVTPSPVRMP